MKTKTTLKVLPNQMTLPLAKQITGGLSNPSKMPCPAYSTPASACKMGAKLQDIEGSICSGCYALKGRYQFSHVQEALQKRLDTITDPRWVEAMAFLINHYAGDIGYFRWHDSGDIQDEQHLLNIIKICQLTPTIKHWLPTREYDIVTKVKKKVETFPANLTIRLSALMFDDQVGPVELAKRLGLTTSGASKEDYNCPAYSQGNHCGACRKCWDGKEQTIIYKWH